MFLLCRLAEWARLHHMLVNVINHSRNVQVSCSLLEQRGGHVVVLQVKVPQISPQIGGNSAFCGRFTLHQFFS